MMNLNDLLPAVIILVVLAIVTSFGATILTTFQADQTTNGYAYNITGKGLEGLETIGNQQPNIALVVVAVIIIGLLVGSFAVLR